MKYGKLEIAEKRVAGVTVGYLVGWFVRPSWRVRDNRLRFRRVRADVTHKTLEEARAFRDYIESQRRNENEMVTTFTRVD